MQSTISPARNWTEEKFDLTTLVTNGQRLIDVAEEIVIVAEEIVIVAEEIVIVADLEAARGSVVD